MLHQLFRTMKIRFITFLIFSIFCLLCKGEENSSKPVTKQNIDLLNTTLRPKDTSSLENNVECYIKGEYVYIEFEAYEGMVTTQLTNMETGEEQTSNASSLYPIQIYVGNQPASYEIYISTSYNSYIGHFTIE